jgi:hypothetical protein
MELRIKTSSPPPQRQEREVRLQENLKRPQRMRRQSLKLYLSLQNIEHVPSLARNLNVSDVETEKNTAADKIVYFSFLVFFTRLIFAN